MRTIEFTDKEAQYLKEIWEIDQDWYDEYDFKDMTEEQLEENALIKSIWRKVK